MIEQRTEEWFAQRVGKVTASRISDVMAKLKNGKPGASRETYMGQLIAERLSGTPMSSFSNAAMQWGTETEPMARDAYSFSVDVEVVEVGLIDHPTISMSGASPDGLVMDDGLVEIKCPNTSTHIDTLLSEKIQQKYVDQMQWQMACTERDWCDFVSFDPRMPATMNLWIKRVERDENRITEMEREVSAFIAELDERVEQLTKRYGV